MAKKTVNEHIEAYREAKRTGDIKTRQKEFKAIMKIADSRLRELEKLEKQVSMIKMAREGIKKAQKWLELHHVPSNAEYFEDITQFAYKTAMYNLVEGLGVQRFDIKPQSWEQERALIATATHFLESKTSSKAEILKSYKKRVDTFNKKWNTNLTWQDLEKFAESNEFKELLAFKGDKYTSDSIAEAYGKLRTVSDPVEIIDKIKNGSEQTIFTDSPMDEIAKIMIKDGIFDKMYPKKEPKED